MAGRGATTLEFGKGESAQVAIITGAARGLGRSWAIALAERGVRVVVNDNDPDRSLVDAVVEQIKTSGGIAVADYNSVTEGEKIAQSAVKHFRRIDILINVRVAFGYCGNWWCMGISAFRYGDRGRG